MCLTSEYRKWGNYKGHFCFKGTKYKGSGERALHISNRTVVECERTCAGRREAVKQAVTDFVRTLPERVRGKIGKTEIEVVMLLPVVKRLLEAGAMKEEPAAVEMGREVELAKKRLRGAVLSEIDKERGMIVVM